MPLHPFNIFRITPKSVGYPLKMLNMHNVETRWWPKRFTIGFQSIGKQTMIVSVV